jgi:pilus assembly protein CpaB
VLAINLRLGETGTTGVPANPEAPNEAFQGSSIATLELDPSQGEVVINASKIGTISLSLRSIADFASTEDNTRRTNQNIRLIRAGNDSTVIAGQNAPPDGAAPADPSNPDALPPTVTQ